MRHRTFMRNRSAAAKRSNRRLIQLKKIRSLQRKRSEYFFLQEQTA